jgi:hypothetical protein
MIFFLIIFAFEYILYTYANIILIIKNGGFMAENSKSKQEEHFKICPNNQSLLVGSECTIKDRYTNEVLEPVPTHNGYLQVKNPKITVKNPRKNEYVHRLMALTYVPGYSRQNWICHHKDKDRRNNLPKNLLWSSPETHMKIHGYYPYRVSA